MTTPLQRYERDLAMRGFTPDAAQRRAVEQTQALYETLTAARPRPATLLSRWSSRHRSPAVRGLYFWGGVGRGKTWLVDAFFDCLPFREKMRMHFHRFMQHVHQELRQLQRVEDPLRTVAARLSERARVLCFDEFHVSDITDAMLLGNLLAALFERGMVLVATANNHPDELYRDGLQRARFLPAIALIKAHTQVLELDGGTDYRMRYLDRAEIYHSPLDAGAAGVLADHFERIAPGGDGEGGFVEIAGRRIATVRHADGVVWFDFLDLCGGPRGPGDYIEIARLFQTVLLSEVPKMTDDFADPVKRFITLVDEFYERNVRLIITAEAPPGELYRGKRHAHAFLRTVSRLVEMQSRDYLSRPHRSG